MISNLSVPLMDERIDYPSLGSHLPFSSYITQCQFMIAQRRPDLNGIEQEPHVNAQQIILANSPFEMRPATPIMGKDRPKYGALLVHGLFDCPFSLRDMGMHLQQHGILARGILLPGHGTSPSDLIKVYYQDWIAAVNYGIESLKNEVEEIFIIGFSTGAALAVQQAITNKNIKGVVLLAPAIKIKAPVDLVIAWHYFLSRFRSNNKDWAYSETETNYAKYRSVPFNAVQQVSQLTNVIHDLNQQQPLQSPIFMCLSREDETISSQTALDFFTGLPNQKSEVLLYTPNLRDYPDRRIITRNAYYPDLNIQHFSHISIPFAPNNKYYGQYGDYVRAARIDNKQYIYGAYNRLEVSLSEKLNEARLLKYRRHELTYNPDFEFLADKVVQFIVS